MGTLTNLVTNARYKKYDYSYSGHTYHGIHVFTTLTTQSIAPAISTTKVELSAINPINVPANKVIGKINGCMFNYNTNNFYGFFYQGANQKMYVNGVAYSKYTDIPQNSVMFTEQYYPCFCVKKDGSAAIRWFGSREDLGVALPYCDYIIGSCHALVFDGICAFKSYIYDLEPQNSRFVYNIANPGQNDRFNLGINHNTSQRTLLGHKSSKIYLLVCTDDAMSMDAAANLMADLGCDYAVNMDGGTPSQMRIAAGYGPAGRVTQLAGCKLHTAVCAYNK